MHFNIKERLILAQLLPKEANFTTMKLISEARTKLGLTDEEHQAFNIATIGEMITWDDKAEELFYAENGKTDFDLGQVVMLELRKELKKLDETNKLRAEHISLYEKIVEGGLAVVK